MYVAWSSFTGLNGIRVSCNASVLVVLKILFSHAEENKQLPEIEKLENLMVI